MCRGQLKCDIVHDLIKTRVSERLLYFLAFRCSFFPVFKNTFSFCDWLEKGDCFGKEAVMLLLDSFFL